MEGKNLQHKTTSCSTSMNDLAALFSKAFPCLVLRFIILDCFFCMRTVEMKFKNKKWLTSSNFTVDKLNARPQKL